MSEYFFYFLAFTIFLKVIWNIAVIFSALRLRRKTEVDGDISLMPIEFLFLFLLCGYSFFNSDFNILGLNKGSLLLFFVILIGLSYLIIWLMLFNEKKRDKRLNK